MSQAIHLDACKHGFLPACCRDSDCRNSPRAKALYTEETRPLRLALASAKARITDLERRLAAANETRPHPLRDRAMRLADVVAAVYSISREALLKGGRFKSVTEPRHVLYYVCRHATEPQWSYPEIGLALKGRDHTTIMHGARTIERRIQRDQHLAHRVARAMHAARVAEGLPVGPVDIGPVPDVPDLEV